MNVTEIQGVFHPEQLVERTDDDMRREFYYIAAGQITQNCSTRGLSPPANMTRSWRKPREILPADCEIYPVIDLLFRAFRVIYTIPF